MKALSFETEAEALQRSKDEADSHGCGDSEMTQYWWSVSQATDGTWCCWIGDDSVNNNETILNKEIKKHDENI